VGCQIEKTVAARNPLDTSCTSRGYPSVPISRLARSRAGKIDIGS
jgi:hypothetical protein